MSSQEELEASFRAISRGTEYRAAVEAAHSALAFMKDAPAGGPEVVMNYALVNATLAAAAATMHLAHVYDSWQARREETGQ